MDGPSVNFYALGALVKSTGTPTFSTNFQSWISANLVKDPYHIIAIKYCVPPNKAKIDSIAPVFSTGQPEAQRAGEAKLALDLYIEDECWNLDPISSQILNARDKFLIHASRPAYMPTRYGEFVKRSQLGEECTIVYKELRDYYSFSIFKNLNAQPFNMNELNALMKASDFFIPLLLKHEKFGAQDKDKRRLSLSVNFENRILASDISLSCQEMKVCRAILLGHTVKEISSLLNLKESSIRTYIDRAVSKIGIESKSELVFWTMEDS